MGKPSLGLVDAQNGYRLDEMPSNVESKQNNL